ncbi:MAG: YgaP family membrane protein [Thermodesulfobacteriota bacterium]
MTVNEGMRMVAGGFVLISVLLAVLWSQWWLLFTVFVGANLLQSAFTKWCPMMSFLRIMGFKEG